jgi:hypothetical protein
VQGKYFLCLYPLPVGPTSSYLPYSKTNISIFDFFDRGKFGVFGNKAVTSPMCKDLESIKYDVIKPEE